MPRSINRFSSRTIFLVIGMIALAALTTTGAVFQKSVSASPQNDTTPAQLKTDAAKRTVLITGANRGIGLEFARQYSAAGWNVIATARDPDAATELKALGPNMRIVQLDVASDESVAELAKSLGKQPIDLLINNAGIGLGANKLEEIKIDEFAQVLQVNAIGPMRVTQALLPNLRAGDGKTIVSISSGLGSIANNKGGGFYGYRESKAALNMFMRTLGAELKDEGFICFAMSPGWVQTDMGGPNAKLTPEESITGMRTVIDGLKPEHAGTFQSHDGTTLPW
jgi:NAD(P)-dependent dehydrogenase (short-subunit alcohol dehydrogenase family)